VADTIFEMSEWIAAPPEIVFQYFVDPEKLVQWMGLKAEVDAATGGAWRILFPGGLVTWGRFVTITPPKHLVFTWGSRHPDGKPEPGGPGHTILADSVVEVTLTTKGERTLLHLKHTGFAEMEGVAVGWNAFLGVLARIASI
jgi:uncharacterized protein YndB with AHSA1/START domain